MVDVFPLRGAPHQSCMGDDAGVDGAVDTSRGRLKATPGSKASFLMMMPKKASKYAERHLPVSHRAGGIRASISISLRQVKLL